MTENDKLTREALHAAQRGDVSTAKLFLLPFAQDDPTPLFYWLAQAEISRIKGETEEQANCLWKFKSNLTGRLLTDLGAMQLRPGDAEILKRDIPPELIEASRVAAEALADEDYAKAVPLLLNAIDLEIADLKRIGDDIFE